MYKQKHSGGNITCDNIKYRVIFDKERNEIRIFTKEKEFGKRKLRNFIQIHRSNELYDLLYDILIKDAEIKDAEIHDVKKVRCKSALDKNAIIVHNCHVSRRYVNHSDIVTLLTGLSKKERLIILNQYEEKLERTPGSEYVLAQIRGQRLREQRKPRTSAEIEIELLEALERTSNNWEKAKLFLIKIVKHLQKGI